MRLFLYGTLIADSGAPMGRWLSRRTGKVEPGTVPGRMIAVPGPNGWYPALVPGTGEVRGVVCNVRFGASELALLDRYEGHEYRRVSLRVTARSGLLTAQGWRWRGRPPAGAIRVPSGDFLAWLASTGHPVLSSRNGY